MFRKLLTLAGLMLAAAAAAGEYRSEVWCADCGDGTYRNPVLHADYSDPDVVRVGDDYWMTASSFQCVPALPILHSKDLVNWTLVNHALPQLPPAAFFAAPQHGRGVWAPCIRHHAGSFYIYWGDPDFGIYMIRTDDPRGRWSEPVLVLAGKGLIDPAPLWDDDGRVWLAHAWAASRSGVNSIVTLVELNAEGTAAISSERIIFDGNDGVNHTVEGAKLYKRNGWYYLFAPAGGVATGWQVVARSRRVDGAYEARTVLAQGATAINGPHQGAWVETPSGESWFFHFQDKGVYGRVVHLNPMRWTGDDWCVIGEDADGDGCGEPVSRWRKPDTGSVCAVANPQESDEFDAPGPGLQWQWHANPEPWFGFAGVPGRYRMYASRERFRNLWTVPNLLLQKFPAEAFTATAKIRLCAKAEGDSGSLVVMGYDYARLAVTRCGDKASVDLITCRDADRGTAERRRHLAVLPLERHESGAIPLLAADVWLRAEIAPGGICRFAYSTDGEHFLPAGKPFTARVGKWIGAKIGLCCINDGSTSDRGWIDADWFRITKNVR